MSVWSSIRSTLRTVPFLREANQVARIGADALSERVSTALGRSRDEGGLQQLFEERTDPWAFETDSEGRARFERIWELVPAGSYRRILEIGCAEGHFTEQIAHRFPDAEIVVTDLIMQAVERAAVRCREFPNVSARHHDIATDDLDGRFDLVFCMGVLEQGPKPGQLEPIRNRIVDALEAGGLLLLESWRLPPEFENRWWARRFHSAPACCTTASSRMVE